VGAPVKTQNWAERLAAIFGFVDETDPTEIEPIRVNADGRLLVQVDQPIIPTVENLATHTFSVSGAGFVFDPIFVDVEGYAFFALWVTNDTGTNNIAQVAGTLAEETGGGGQNVISQASPVPGFVNPDVFLTSSTAGLFSFDFNNSQTFLFHGFRSIAAGYKLSNPAPAQNITVRYKGIRYF
jgi:hypothetical protein